MWNFFTGLFMLLCSLYISDAASCGDSNLTAIFNTSYLVSPGYPSIASGDEACTWLISKSSTSARIHVRLQVKHMNITDSLTACTKDYLEIFDGPTPSSHSLGRWCGQQRPMVQSSWNSLTVRYKRSNSSAHVNGFQLKYFQTDEYWSCGGMYNATTVGSYLQAPGYPISYRTDANCLWVIEVPDDFNIRVIVEDYDILSSKECYVDDLRFVDGRSPHDREIGVLCGRQPGEHGIRQFTSSGQVLRIEFTADPSRAVVRPRGFKLAYLKGKFDPCEDTHLWASETPKFITSPNYPGNYTSNSRCLWRIETLRPGYVVQVTPLHFSVQLSANCTSDYLSLYDGPSAGPGEAPIGKWCGYHMPSVQTSQASMLMVFHTDGDHSESGFNISYVEIPRPGPTNGGAGVAVSATFCWLLVVSLSFT